jgi:hypothetical protein
MVPIHFSDANASSASSQDVSFKKYFSMDNKVWCTSSLMLQFDQYQPCMGCYLYDIFHLAALSGVMIHLHSQMTDIKNS